MGGCGMFGYIRVNAQELRVREYDLYRALYCGLCKHMGKCTGHCSRLSLSYDFVFLAAVRIALLGEPIKTVQGRCLVHPFRRRRAVKNSPTLAFCAHASALLTYQKLCDDCQDERGLKRLRAQFSKPLFYRAYKKAKNAYPTLDEKIRDALSSLSEIERNTNALPSADEPAMRFGELMAAVCSEGLEGNNARLASVIGKAVGHWIYLIDAADDYPEDCKKDRYNPYRRVFDHEPTEEDWNGVRVALTLILEKAEQAYLLIPPHEQPEINEILANLFYLGMPSTAKKVIPTPITNERCQAT